MKNKTQHTLFLFMFCLSLLKLNAQILTSSPYSRYGIGEINTTNFSAINALGGSFSAFQPDTIAPFFINPANPASLAGLRLSSFEVGGQAQFSNINSATSTTRKTNINFSYGSIGFPLRRFGGAAFGIMPYSTVGYKITSYDENPSIGQIKYVYEGSGGFNKAFLATGIKPFSKSYQKFIHSALRDSLWNSGQFSKIKRYKFFRQLASELSLGVNANYIFGNTNQSTHIIYPGSISYYNTGRERMAHLSDFAFNTGIQTAFTIDQAKRRIRKDSVVKRELKEKIKVVLGAYANLPTILNGSQSSFIYNYAIDGFGNQQNTDTILKSVDTKGQISIPLEIGGGFSVKKGEKITFLLDGATTYWKNFKYFNDPNSFSNSYRISAGINYVPNKLAFGGWNYVKRTQYRLGFTYSDGYIDLKNNKIKNYAVTAGLGLPVGIGRFDDIAIVNITAQFGTTGTTTSSLLQEKYVRLIVGFTFNKRWFIKYKYD